MVLPRALGAKVLSNQPITVVFPIVLICALRPQAPCAPATPETNQGGSQLAHSLSAIKRVRQNEKRRIRNGADRTRLRTQIKKLRDAMEKSELDDAQKLVPSTVSLIDIMVKKGVIHENAGNRYKSRLTRRLLALKAS